MTFLSKSTLIVISAATLSGCAIPTRENLATTPVNVETPQGTVTCQLYTSDTTLWDEAIAHPESMTSRAADKVCKAEGRRRAT
ncbi:hypothetical protein [Ruegeria sp. HKCCD8929]|uniref:hypothetical protein n=1 Tax=Ruegeria sp. HKCCD8929 TaxID=2683006 RepID=UPI001489AC77|nr:hypothetical protein [Ruegeria sp. HKCCD8929]